MDICVLSHVGGFRLGKLVSILSNENKRMEVATHIHKRCAERYINLYMTSYEMLLTHLLRLAVNLSTLLHSIFCPIMLTPSSFI